MRKYTSLEYLTVMASVVQNSGSFYKRPYQNESEVKIYQEKQIKKLLDHAYNNTTLYREKYNAAGVRPEDFHTLKDLQKFPSVTKDEIIGSFPTGCVSKNINEKKMIASISSGSSGKVIKILHDPEDTWAYILGRSRILNMTNLFTPLCKTLYIYTSPFPAGSFFGLYPSYFIPTLNKLENTVQLIKSLKPNIICSYPSVLLELMQCFKPQDTIPLRLISVGSELSSAKQRETLSRHFRCPVLDEYSSEELGWIATQCIHKTYHVWDDISYIEGSQSDSTEIIGTNLHNFAMPFIRYRQGDTGIIHSATSCPCGRNTRILTRIFGRKNDEFIFANGKKLTSAYLLDTVYSILLDLDVDIVDFCLIQVNKTCIKLEIIPGKSFKKQNIKLIYNQLATLMPNGVVSQIAVVTALYKTIAGKRNPIISLAH